MSGAGDSYGVFRPFFLPVRGGLGESVKGQLLKSIGWHGVNFPGAGFAIVAICHIGG